MDEDDERSAYYSSVQDPTADDSVSLSSQNIRYWKPQRLCLCFHAYFFLHIINLHFVIDPIPLTFH